MEKQQIVLGNRDGGAVFGTAPAFFVILKQQQGNGKADQGILVANRDACALASSVSAPVKSKVKTCLPADCVSGGITVTLDNNSMWNEFYHRNTEMILTKQGRRMFPYCRYWITGLDAGQKYILVMDISPVDNYRYKWNGRWWEPSGKAEPHVLGRVFIHPQSPSTGRYWMHQPVSFYKLKLTNNTLDQEGHIILHSMHRYLPRLHLVPADKATEVIQLNGPDVHTFTFPQTEFFAVTAYQNIQITQLKIDYNPFAKGFRDDGLNSRPQRDVKQNSNLELEGGNVFSSASLRGRPAEVDALGLHQRSLDSSFVGQNPSDIDMEKESFNAERDFMGFLDTDLASGDMPKLKQEASESPITSSYKSSSRVASPVDPNGHFNVVIKEEPVDDYDYETSICTQGITVKQEDTDEETDEYSNTDDDDPILQKRLRRRSETDGNDGEFRSRKRVLTSPSGVAKAKMLKLDSGKMPVVYLEPCAVTKSTVKISELPQTMLSSCKKDKSPLSAILDSLPVCFENHKDSCTDAATVTEEIAMKKISPGSKLSQKYSSIKEAQWVLSKSPNFNLRGSVSCHFSDKEICGRKKPGILKNPVSMKGTGSNQNAMSSGTTKRGRPRKLKISKAGRPPKGIGKPVITSKNSPLGPGSILPDVKPDLEDVDGVLFVSFASKEALDIHTVDRAGGEESQNLQAPLLTTNDPDCQARIQVLEKELMEELKTLRHKQVIHPSLQEVGLKLNSVDPTMSIDLKYLGVQLPLSYSNYSLWSYPGTNPNSPDTGFPFVSRTGKTNDFTKIKGWRGKLHGASRNEGGSSEGSLKNRSAFCSDKLDEYLENEGKLMETSMGFSSSTPTSPVVYQLPTKSTSYVRTLDSVLKKQSTIIPSTSYTFKPVSMSSTSRKAKTQNRQTSSNRGKSSYKPILPSPFSAKQKQNFSASGEKGAKSLSNSSLSNQADSFLVPALDENILPKQISLRQAPQQQQGARPPGLSKSQVKLMDLEDCALWDGKPRTYITEERADISLATLLTAQASLKNKPIHKIIRRRAPPCNNDFCRLGCICASLALEKRQPTHCRRPDCMFGCTCLKRKVLLVKGGSKHKKILKKAVRGSLVFYGTQEEHQEDEDAAEEGDGEEDEVKQKDKKKRKKVEYTICDSEPEKPIRNCPLWVKVEGEIDPEPIYIPTPSVIEPVKPAVLPNPEVLISTKHRSSSGVKTGRVYTPKPNPVIREEDKDPVYLYFESMMTCARVRVYEPGKEEKKQQKDQKDSQSSFIKMYEQGLQSSKKESSKKELSKKESVKKESCKKEACEINKDPDKFGAARPSPGGVFTKFVMNKVGALQQKIPAVSTCQPPSGPPQKFNIKPTPVMVVAPVVPSLPSPAQCTLSPGVTTAITTSPVTVESTSVAASTVTAPSQTRASEPASSPPAITVTGASATPGINTCTTSSPATPTATVNITKATAIAAPVPTVTLATVVTTPTITCPVVTTSTSTVVLTTAVATSVVTTPTSSISSVPIILSGVKSTPSLAPKREDAAPQALNKTPPKISPGTEKRAGPRLLLIPVHQTSPTLRPLNNVQLPQRQRMILQPLRSPGGVNLFRHPNGQIIQLVPLHQFRAPGTQPSAQPSVQPVMFRNPGSVVGIRLPAPAKPPESPLSPPSSVSSTSPATNPASQTAGPKLSPTSNLVTQAPSVLPSVTSFVSQAGTLTLRISPPAASNMTNQTASESKITCSSGVLPASTANLIPLQSGSFALLQLPGQKTVPNSILHHFASLQMKKDSKKISQKDDSGAAQQKETGKALCSEEVEVTESEVTVSDSKQEENEVSVSQPNNVEEPVSDTVTPGKNSTALETVEKDSKALESSCDESSLQHDVSTDVISSDHSYISEKPNDEENEVVTDEKDDSVHSETVVETTSTNSETICGSSDQSVAGPLDSAHPQGLSNQETAQLKNHGKEQMPAEQEEKPVKAQEGDAQAQMKESNKSSSGQSRSQQEQGTQLENKKEQRGTELPHNKKECQGDAVQPEMERKQYKGSTEAESLGVKKGSKSEMSSAKEQGNTSGEIKAVNTEEGKTNSATQENSNNKEQGAVDSQEEMKMVKDIVIHANSSWSKISSIAPALENKSEADNKADRSDKGDFLTPEQRAQEPKRHKKGGMPPVDTPADYMEEEEYEDDDEDEKTDDSADEILDGASDFPSEEEIDVEKVFQDACEYSEDDEQVDIETVEELSEKINIARLKATAANIRPSKEKYHAPNSSDEKLSENPMKQNPQIWSRKQKTEEEAFAHYRQTHTANERRRRNEMRDLFDKLKRALGLHNLPKVSKCYILKQAFDEIQGLTDQADKLTGQKNLLARKQDTLIRKVSTLSGKTEEVVLKKLEYMYAKQKAIEAQKKKKQVQPAESVVTSTATTQQEASSLPSRDLGKVAVTNRRGKPLILARKGSHATEDTSSSLTLTAASLVMTPQGQVLTLKSPLVPGQVAAVPSTLLQAELKPRAANTTVTAQPGIASVMIQLPGSTVPVQVKGIITNSTIPITLSAVAGNPVPSTVVSATEPHSESEDSFMMPRIVNVTSLAAEGSMNLNPNRNKNSNTTTAAATQASEKSLVVAPLESRKSDSILSEEKAKQCPGDSGGDGRSTTGTAKGFFENKDGFPQIRNVSCTKERPESFGKKLCIGEFVGSQARKKDSDPGGERLKMKELPFRKLQLKDSRIEMELRKVASAMEEAELDTGELLSSIEESDDTDETLTSLLNEIAFLNQQLNDDASGMSELPSTLNSDFSHGDAEGRRGTGSDLSTADGSSFQFGHLGGSFKDLSEVPEGGGSLSPLLLHLEDDDITDGDKNSGEPSSEADVLKIVIGAEMKDPLPNLSITSGGNGKTAETTSVTPPVLQMKTNPEASNADTLWRPMPKLAPLGLKVASLPVDSEGQSTKVMPLLAPIVAKLAPTGVKTSSATVQEGQDSKVMPALAPVGTKFSSTGTLPSNSAGK
ncbi:MAX gene-associated protein isoform X18 [Cygnus olor]|uniref:MAX gene-associated protein isoform X18 n=1 Tax=Cygnus olor TaxID=8869 RepID=UPI001ADEB123|nr:MAX gene-associated protein isoform X18 [Cygnus olor]XP_040413660.1 MAX gene-associated protein isoform X18 [Cygnus olor]